MADKVEIRRRVKSVIRSLSEDNCRLRAVQLGASLEQMSRFQDAEHIFIFWSLADEISTHEFIQKWCPTKMFYLPVMNGDDLQLVRYKGAESMVSESRFGISEPVGDQLEDEALISLAIIPGVAFTDEKARLGRGKGFYDRVLPRLSNAWKIGVGYREQMVDCIPIEVHDYLMDEILVV